MKSRLRRIRQLIDELEKQSGPIDQEQLCKTLSISPITLIRYISYLRSWGFCFETADGTIHMVAKGTLAEDPSFSKGDYISFRILMYIYNNNPCRRERLRNYFCSKNNEETTELKMTLRNVDLHIKKLIQLGYIEKYDKDNTLYYHVTKNLLLTNSIAFDRAIQIYNYLNIYHRALPFQDSIQAIIDKLGSAMTNYIRKSTVALEDMRLLCEVFPDCLMANTDPSSDQMALELEEYCQQNCALEIHMKSGSELRVLPFCVVYNWHSGKWYLVYRHTSDDEGFDLARVENICNVNIIEQSEQPIIKLVLDEEKKRAQKEVEESFAISIEEPLFVQISFRGDENLKAAVRRKLCACNGAWTIDNEDRLIFSGYIEGKSDFMAWIRRFGSNVIVYEPQELANNHQEDAMRALARYYVKG